MTGILVNHVSPTPDRVTGLTVYTWRILEALVRHGRHRYVLATNWSLDRLPPEIAALPIAKVSRRVPASELAATMLNSAALPLLARRHDCRLVFHPQPTSALTGMAASVVVLHDLYAVTHPTLHSARKRFMWRHVAVRGLRRASALISVSEATRAAAITAYPDLAGRITVVHEASPLDVGAAPAAPFAGPEPYALMVANVTPNKNVGLLFAALDRLAANGVAPEVRLVGRDPGGLLPELMQRHPGARVTLMGGVGAAELRALYAGATAYVNCSIVEGFCLPILEAQALGAPVICSDIPVLREVAGDGAVFVDPRDPQPLADALARLFGDPAAAGALAARGRANEARFSWTRAARETEAVFDRILVAA